MSVSEPIQYTPLQPGRSIRLIWPDEKNDGFTLREFDLDSCPEFEVVSYRWDSERELKPAVINSHTARVSQNCATAMQCQLRRWGSKRHFWIDAVCIDQSNVYERNHQVSLMADIYKGASRVLVWLGDELDNPNFSLDIRAGVKAGIFDMNTILEDPNHPMSLPRADPEAHREIYEVT